MVRTRIEGRVDICEQWPWDYPLKDYEEGKTAFKIIEAENIYDAPAFFNPVMVLNRDFSILNAFVHHAERGRPIRVFEPLAGIGVRGFRLINEIGDALDEVVINDFGDVSTDLARYNRKFLGQSRLIQYKREARALAASLAENSMKYHFIDLDPFGSPSPFLDSIWRLASRNGIIGITATDMTALAGVFPKACLRKYGGLPVNNHQTHETAVRLLLAKVARSAANFETGIEPLVSISSDHYVKVFIRVRDGRGQANSSVQNIENVFFCPKCQYYAFESSGYSHHSHGQPTIAGPLWKGELFQREWCQKSMAMLEDLDLPSSKKMGKILDEGVNGHDLPYYYALDQLASILHVNTPRTSKLIDYIQYLGFKALKTTFRKQALRTNAPYWILEEAMKSV